MTREQISVAVCHPRLGFGGSEACAMWTLEALKDNYRVALVAGGRIDIAALNSFCGTSIDPTACEVVELPLPRLLSNVQWGAAIRGAVVSRSMRRHFDRFDVLVSAYNISDFGRPGIHYVVDFSWDESTRQHYDQPPPGLRSMIHRVSMARRVYRTLAHLLEGKRHYGSCVRTGKVLSISKWTHDLLLQTRGVSSELLYPPLALPAASNLATRKTRRFICLGRISPEKRLEQIIYIVKRVREKGHDIALHIIGDTHETAYGRNIEAICRAEERWIVLEGRKFGEAKARLLAESAFGIHARPGEAFGIAVAEMIAMGCIPFVPAEGGPAEIVENNPRLVYATPEEAVEKIDTMLRNPILERETRSLMRLRAQIFSPESFMRGIRRIVDEFIASQRQPHPKEANQAAI